jgi:hypothetical protein
VLVEDRVCFGSPAAVKALAEFPHTATCQADANGRVRPGADVQLLFVTYLMLPKRTKSHLAAQLGRFVQQYGRKATKGWDPNDRGYDRKLEEKIKRLSPEDLSDLLSGEDVKPVQPHSKATKETDN